MDYGDKPAAAKRSLLTPPRWSLFAPPLTLNLHHTITQTFNNGFATSTKNFATHDHFIGPSLALGFHAVYGPWLFVARGFVAPGVMFANGMAREQVSFGAGANLSVADRATMFAVRAALEINLAYHISQFVTIGFLGSFSYQSANSYWHNPISPIQQPASLSSGHAKAFFAGVFVRIQFGGPSKRFSPIEQ